MRNPRPDQHLKAWARDYNETPFCFEQSSAHGRRLVAWTEDDEQTRRIFYALLDSFPQTIKVLLKICVGQNPKEKPLWSRYQAEIDRLLFVKTVQANEHYVFSDGMNQLCIKDPESDRYFAFDDHGIFFLYAPLPTDVDLFRSHGFAERYAEPLYAIPHFQHTLPNSERLEMKFLSELNLKKTTSDLE